MNITVNRGPDGFGSQLLSIISGIAYCKAHGYNYIHTPLIGFYLLDKPNEMLKDDLNDANNLLNRLVEKLNYKIIDECFTDNLYVHDYFYNEILLDCDKYYNDSFLNFISSAYDKAKPEYYKDEFNIAIHIRRGNDIPEKDIPIRVIENSVYEQLIYKLNLKYPNSKIHIFSWNNPNLNLNLDNIVYHIVDEGNKFLEDFNALVHADLLVVGSSTFSASAGILNKNTVICNDNIFKIMQTPIPKKWMENYYRIIDR
jgi:hypothetical protein